MTALLLGPTKGSVIRFMREIDGGGENVTVAIEPREWDVTNADARESVARELLGDDYQWHCEHRSAQWWIDADRNAAGLAVYRPR